MDDTLQATVELLIEANRFIIRACTCISQPAPVYICAMYSKQEAARSREAFWTAFGQYMAPVLSTEGEKVNWVNYKTGEKNIAFRMQADSRKASIAIEMTHGDEGIQQLYFDLFLQLKPFFVEAAGDHWTWQALTNDEHGRKVSRIYTEEEASIFKKEDWPQLIRFFKQHLMALDMFWSEVKYGFESLR